MFHDEGCNFSLSNQTIFLEQFLKINFFLTNNLISQKLLPNSSTNQMNILPTSLVQGKIVKILYPNSCAPQCVKGVCYNEICLCKSGFSGEDCSIGKILSNQRIEK